MTAAKLVYRGYTLMTESLRTDVWFKGELIDSLFGPKSVTKATSEIDEWLEAK